MKIAVMFDRRRPDRTPRSIAEAEIAEQVAAFRLQYEHLAWRQARGLTPDVEKVAAVDRAVGDLFEGGDYLFPLLHREAEAAGRRSRSGPGSTSEQEPEE